MSDDKREELEALPDGRVVRASDDAVMKWPAHCKAHDVIQLVDDHEWGPLLCVVEEVKEWGVKCYALIPESRGAPPNRMHMRVTHDRYVRIGPAAVVWTAT